MASLKEVKRLKELCEKYELEGRGVLDALHPSLAPVAFIHDIEWSLSDGTKVSFTESNRRFKRNGYKVAKAMFPWWRPRRYAVMADAARFSRLCQKFGWAAWRMCQSRSDLGSGEAVSAKRKFERSENHAPFTAKDVESQRMSAPLIATPSGRSSTGGYAVILASTKAPAEKPKRTRKRTAEATAPAAEEGKE